MLKKIDLFFENFYESGATFFQGFGALIAVGFIFKTFDKENTLQDKLSYWICAAITLTVFILINLRYRKKSPQKAEIIQKANTNKNVVIIQESKSEATSHQEANNNEGGSIHQK